MASPLPPDPYQALGVAKDADVATIKSTYRKLALKCHPDKVTDEALKAQKQEEFHKINQAYNLLVDDVKRKEYDASVRLAQLRREALERGSSGPRVEVRTGYGVRTAVPPEFKSPRPHEEPRKRPSYEDDKYQEASRKYDDFDKYTRRPSGGRPREREESKASPKEADRTRSDRKKTRDREERRDRAGKYSAYVDDDSDERVQFETKFMRRSEEEQRIRQEGDYLAERGRRQSEDSRRKVDELRRRTEDAVRQHRVRVEEYPDSRSRKLNEQEAIARAHISKLADGSKDPYVVRRVVADRPEVVRRSSARPRDRESSRRDAYRERRGSYDDPLVEERRPPMLATMHSSPAKIRIPKPSPTRAHTLQPEYEREAPPVFRRSETSPNISSSSPTFRREKTVSGKSASLREATVLDSSPNTPESRQPTTKIYTYSPSAGASLHPEDGYHTITREPGRRRHSPSPVHETRPPLSHARTVPSTSRYPTIPAPSLHRSATTRSPERSATYDSARGRDRDRDRERRPLYGEYGRGRERREQPSSYKYEDVSFMPRYGRDDISYGPLRPEHVVERPGPQRSATFAY